MNQKQSKVEQTNKHRSKGGNKIKFNFESSYKIVTLNDLMREVEAHKEITFVFDTNLYCLKQMIYPKKDRLNKHD